MFKKILAVVLLSLLFAPMGYGLDVGKVSVPDSITTTGGETLVLNGAGLRTKFFIKAYVGSLYLTQKSQEAQAIIDADEPMAITLHITSGMITSKKMEDATREGFENSTNGNIEPLKDEIESFINVFREKIQKNDMYELVYVPGKGVETYKNKVLASTIPGLVFKKALFGIWLCDKPAQENLKQGMLGM